MENDEVSIDGTPVVGRVISQSTKLFRTKAILAYLVGPIYDFTKTRFEINNPIPVYDSDNKHLGYANINVVTSGTDYPNRLVADMSIDYHCEERLLSETKQERFYPRIFGAMRTNSSTEFDFSKSIQVDLLVINGIVLSRKRPNDDRIPAFGDVVL